MPAYQVSNLMRDRALAERDATMRAGVVNAHRYEGEVWVRAAYRDYRLAVFEPGLSPEQRRLLFDRALSGSTCLCPAAKSR